MMFKRGILIFLILVALPLYVNAENRSLNYSELDVVHDITVGSLDFKSLKFEDNSNNHIYSFGLIGELENNSSSEIVLKTIIKYYTIDKVLIQSETKEFEIEPNSQYKFIQTRSAHIENSKYDVGDIGLYSIEFETRNGTLKSDSVSISESGKYNDKDFVVDSYHISIDIKDDRSMDIQEKLEVFANGPYILAREIPLDVEIKKNSGMLYKASNTVSNIISNKDYRKKFKDGNIVLEYSKKDEITGTNIYELEYSYDNGRDPYKKTDELYLNVLNNTYGVPIGNVSFKIVLPKEVDTSNFDLSIRSKNEEVSELHYKIVGNTIEGYIEGVLNNEESVFLSLIFENGYFKREFSEDFLENYSVFVIPSIVLFVAFILWLLFGKDRKAKEVFSSTLPKSLDNIDAALVYKGEVSSRDIISLLIGLANNGYIEISNVGEDGTVSLKNISIKKLKEYDGKNEFEKLLLEVLFYKKQASVSESLLKVNYKRGRAVRRLMKKQLILNRKEIINSLNDALSTILDKANSKEQYEKIYEHRATIVGKFTHLLSFVIAISGASIPVYYYAGEGYALGSVILIILGGISLELVMNDKLHTTLKRIALAIFLMIVIMFFYLPIGEALVHKEVYEAGIIFGFLVIFGIIEFVSIMPKRTKYGTNMLGKIDGFKKFIESSNEETILEAYKESPEYFYTILMYSSSISLNDKWYKNFEKCITSYPNWFKTNKNFDLKTFYKDLSNIITYLEKKMDIKRNINKKN